MYFVNHWIGTNILSLILRIQRLNTYVRVYDVHVSFMNESIH